ncbi:MAG: hypothetical protein ACI4QT_09705 [Kiritimatiellia bacterium]
MQKLLRRSLYAAVLSTIAFGSNGAWARNVDLATVPSRAGVELTIYNGEDLTLVRESRVLTMKRGLNGLQFSWAGTRIDPTSVELSFPDVAGKIEILETSFPHDKPQQLSWTVSSETEGDVRAEITYFTSGISWKADYVVTLAQNGGMADVKGYITVANNSGESYDNAVIRLVVGTIHLVDRVADLADAGLILVERKAKQNIIARRSAVVRSGLTISGDERMFSDDDCVAEAPASAPIEKKALSDYFLFTLPGTETVPDRQVKRILFTGEEEAKISDGYRYRPVQYGALPVRVICLENSEENGFGESPFPNGEIRVFEKNDGDGLSYVGVATTLQVPIGDKMEINLGANPDFRFEAIPLRYSRDRIVMQLHGASVYSPLERIEIKPELNATLAGYNLNTEWRHRIVNGTGKAVSFEARVPFQGAVDVHSGELPKCRKFDADKIEYKVELAPQRAEALHFRTVQYMLRNAKERKPDGVLVIEP